MSYHWLLIADASRARVIAADERLNIVAPIEDLVHPASRLHTHELLSDDRGRSRAGPEGPHSAFDGESDRTDTEHDAFAREVAHLCEEGLDRGDYERLIIVAPPRFLGLLRRHLPDRVNDLVALEVGRDLTRLPMKDLGPALQAHLAI